MRPPHAMQRAPGPADQGAPAKGCRRARGPITRRNSTITPAHPSKTAHHLLTCPRLQASDDGDSLGGRSQARCLLRVRLSKGRACGAAPLLTWRLPVRTAANGRRARNAPALAVAIVVMGGLGASGAADGGAGLHGGAGGEGGSSARTRIARAAARCPQRAAYRGTDAHPGVMAAGGGRTLWASPWPRRAETKPAGPAPHAPARAPRRRREAQHDVIRRRAHAPSPPRPRRNPQDGGTRYCGEKSRDTLPPRARSQWPACA